ncbi:unnamed protein product [Pylaiella littoralis]
MPSHLHRLHPDVAWREQVLSRQADGLCSVVLDSGTSVAQLRARLEGLLDQAPVLGAFFVSSQSQALLSFAKRSNMIKSWRSSSSGGGVVLPKGINLALCQADLRL